MFKKYIHNASVFRQTYIDDSGYKKSGYFPTGNTYMGHLKALSIKYGIEISSFGKEYKFHTSANADILESDKLVISGDTYEVKGLSTFQGITFETKICILSKVEPGI